MQFSLNPPAPPPARLIPAQIPLKVGKPLFQREMGWKFHQADHRADAKLPAAPKATGNFEKRNLWVAA
jgi:hypothetical protein